MPDIRANASRVLTSAAKSPTAGRLVLAPVAKAGYHLYRRTDRTPRVAYSAMRKIFSTAPDAFEHLAQSASLELSAEQRTLSGGILSTRRNEALAALSEDGCYIAPDLVDAATCDELEEVARREECRLIGTNANAPARAKFDETNPLAARYDIDEEAIVNCASAQRLIADGSIFDIARAYIGSTPVQDLVAMWWSAAAGEKSSSAAAQQYHFDLDRLRFLKLFLYLTDVDDDTGPHKFVRGTHRSLPQDFRFDRRYSDDEVESAYGDRVITIGGKRGTLFLADTRGLHKGLSVRRGHRLVFQLQYSSSLFGAEFTRPGISNPTNELQEAKAAFPGTYRRFTLNSV